ncbi:MAG: hypothetical protein LBK25_08190 [Treponema sp.]|jgi:NTP pyrophosphatase (non-canonical NTP hydrolase)|nr:hypothetical protein [Treponema sp.]
MKKSLNELRDMAFEYAEKQGFHQEPVNFGERLMLIVSELGEALEADRKGKDGWLSEKEENRLKEDKKLYGITPCQYEQNIRGTVQEELADALIRIFDTAGVYGIDLEFHVAAKMAYNETRPYLHGKKYG